jgi:hypothetical protein
VARYHRRRHGRLRRRVGHPRLLLNRALPPGTGSRQRRRRRLFTGTRRRRRRRRRRISRLERGMGRLRFTSIRPGGPRGPNVLGNV